MHSKLVDITDMKYGDLTVLSRNDKKGGTYWNCRCSCGHLSIVRSDVLRKKNKTHCGCKTRKANIDEKFNRLTVVGFSDRRARSNTYRICKCDCGNITEVLAFSLISGGIKSCGCLVKQFSRYKNPYQVGQIRPWFWSHIIRNATIRNIIISITAEDIWGLWIKQDGLCALSNVKLTLPTKSRERSLTTASLDRIDSNKGYVLGNIQWVHKKVNLMKNVLSQEEFVSFCRLVTKNCP